MKLFVKLMLFILVLGLAGPFFLKKPDGRPYMSLNSLLPDISGMVSSSKRYLRQMTGKMEQLGDQVTGNSGSNSDSDSGVMSVNDGNTVYRWRDENGNWQYSDVPPDTSRGAEKVVVKQNVNVMDAVVVPEKRDETNASSPQIGVPLPLTISPGQVEKLIDDANGVNELMEKRGEMLDSL